MPILNSENSALNATSKLIREIKSTKNEKEENTKEIQTQIDDKKELINQTAIKQTNFEECWTCQRPIGIRGFKCDCEYVFCKKHRIPEDHECNYDF